MLIRFFGCKSRQLTPNLQICACGFKEEGRVPKTIRCFVSALMEASDFGSKSQVNLSFTHTSNFRLWYCLIRENRPL